MRQNATELKIWLSLKLRQRGPMTQKQLSFLYRGVLLFFAGTGAVALLSRANQPWAKEAGTIGGIVVFIAFAAFMAFMAFVSLRGFAQFLNAPVDDKPLPEDLYLDGWYRVAQLAVAVAILLVLTLAAVLLFVEPPQQCPDWRLPGKHPIPWAVVFLWSGAILAGVTFMVVRWKWLIRKAIATVDYPTPIPISYTLVITVLGGCAMSQLPWLELIGKCWLGR